MKEETKRRNDMWKMKKGCFVHHYNRTTVWNDFRHYINHLLKKEGCNQPKDVVWKIV